MSDALRINAAVHSWASSVYKLGNDRYTGLTSFSFSDKIEVASSYGMGRHHAPRGDTVGKYSCENLKIKGAKSTIEAMRTQLAALAPDGRSYGQVRINQTLQFIEAGETPMVIVFNSTRLIVDGASQEESPDPLMDEIEFYVRYITRNGKTLFDSSRGLP